MAKGHDVETDVVLGEAEIDGIDQVERDMGAWERITPLGLPVVPEV